MQPGAVLPSYAPVKARDMHFSARRKGSGSCPLIPNQNTHVSTLRRREHGIALLGNKALSQPWESQDPALFQGVLNYLDKTQQCFKEKLGDTSPHQQNPAVLTHGKLWLTYLLLVRQFGVVKTQANALIAVLWSEQNAQPRLSLSCPQLSYHAWATQRQDRKCSEERRGLGGCQRGSRQVRRNKQPSGSSLGPAHDCKVWPEPLIHNSCFSPPWPLFKTKQNPIRRRLIQKPSGSHQGNKSRALQTVPHQCSSQHTRAGSEQQHLLLQLQYCRVF